MRGKLRDKSSTNRRDTFRRSEGDVRRPYKRDQRNTSWIDPQNDDDEYTYDVDEEELEAENLEEIVEPAMKSTIKK
ncbi:hypothetical protein KDA_34320 [Dictyobacter alpinus]|uniref:Uncharacterized protein n=1 Tax=Dictyobacter alpinus TaxID=2014873 RepID=A0A402B9A6_9CHLR|nr:hypothetical protein [Dictyobacter alpinus]GCE27948.1 hypothetical protein KDA_34320 [Dictyobacter alpinus]